MKWKTQEGKRREKENPGKENPGKENTGKENTGKENIDMETNNKIMIREYCASDMKAMIAIWNEVVEEGIAFPQEELLTLETGKEFFAAQSHSAVIEDEAGKIYGLYILHPNNVGRCAHIANASYAVTATARGKHIGEALGFDSLRNAKTLGFHILQFNAVVESNIHARHLYERLGFTQLGTVPKGFRMKDGHYENICPYYRDLMV